MKTMKNIMALVVVALLVLAMAAPAFAAESYPITIKNPNATAEHTYTAYQIFAGTLSTDENGNKILANIEWGDGVNGDALLEDLQKLDAYKDCKDADSVSKVLEGFNDNSEELKAFAEVVGKHLTSGTVSTASSDNDYTDYTIDPGKPGYYIVKETGVNPESGRSASAFMIEVVGPSEATVKDSDMTPDKNILEAEKKVKEGTANVGDDVQFVVDKIKVPSTDGYKTYKFVMKDTLPKGLTFKNVDSIKFGDETISEEHYEVKPVKNADGTTELRIVFKDALNFLKPYAGKTIEIKYTATVNKDAEFGDTGNKNEVVFEFTNNPDDDHGGDDFGPDEPHGISPKSETTTYVTKIVVKKVDESGKPLGGAVFKLSGSAKNIVVTTGQHFVEAENGTYYKLKDGTYTTTAPTDGTADKYDSTTKKYKLEAYERKELEGADDVDIENMVSDETTGEIVFEGLKPGEYTLTETGAPSGYNKLDDEITFTIKFDTESKKFAFDGEAPDGVTLKDDGTFEIEIENKSGAQLPTTGGMGTTILYIAGAILVLGAGILLVTKRRVG